MKFSRRVLLAGSVAIPFSEWIKNAYGAGTAYTRCSATSTTGKLMLKSYAIAVAKMNQTAKGNPLSWVFQWYTHCVPNSSGGPDPNTKSATINQIYGNGFSANKALAGEMWDTCQPHGTDEREDYFLPWHRMYVYFFERIVRKLSGNPQFAMPYWDYTVSGPNHAVLPIEFRQGVLLGDPQNSPRNPGINSGDAIDKSQLSKLNLDALGEGSYQALSNTEQGFCMNLDLNLHGLVHVYTGGTTNMGQVPYAAGDPVFWAHHCNIDRIWASWNKNGGKNPTDDSDFMNQTFVFADENGTRVAAKVLDFLDITGLDYTYDALAPAPAGFRPLDLGVSTRLSSDVSGQSPPLAASQSVSLGNGRSTFELSPTEGIPLQTSLQSENVPKKLYLVARDLRVAMQPGVVYDVFLNLPPDLPTAQASRYWIGSINFFAFSHHAPDGMNGVRFWRADLTRHKDLVAGPRGGNRPPRVTIIPAGQPREGSNPVIGSVRLVQF